MDKVVGIKFKETDKIFDFDAEGLDLEIDDKVVVKIENDLAKVAEGGGIMPGWEELLMNAVLEELSETASGVVTEVLENYVRSSIAAGESLHTWTEVIATLDKHLRLLVQRGTDEYALVESLMHRSRVAVSEAAEQVHASQNRALHSRTVAFNEAAAALLTGERCAGVEARHALTVPAEARPACPDPTAREPDAPRTCGG